MEFSFYFLRVFALDLAHASPLLICLLVLIGGMGYLIGRIEGWSKGDALYHAFINATTVGYGDFRPTKRISKLIAVGLAFVGLVFTGMVVAIALHAADHAYAQVYEVSGFLHRAAD